MMPAFRRRPRKGGAVMWALVVLTFVSAMSLAALGQFGTARRLLDTYAHRTQAAWLARSGVELAAARLLAEPDGYTGETVKPVPGSEVRIAVEKDPAEPDVYRVQCEARFPSDSRLAVRQLIRRTLKRVSDPKGTRIEFVQAPD